jgi:hypothetical protein
MRPARTCRAEPTADAVTLGALLRSVARSLTRIEMPARAAESLHREAARSDERVPVTTELRRGAAGGARNAHVDAVDLLEGHTRKITIR